MANTVDVALWTRRGDPAATVARRWLRRRGVAFRERSLGVERPHGHPADAALAGPILFIGDAVVVGCDPERLSRLLPRAGHGPDAGL